MMFVRVTFECLRCVKGLTADYQSTQFYWKSHNDECSSAAIQK